MIYGTIAGWRNEKKNFPAVFDKAFAFLEGKDIASLSGKHEIDGDWLFISFDALRTEDQEKRRFEAHEKYLDIQILFSGREKQLYAPDLSGMNVTEDKYATNDIAFYTAPEHYSSLVLEAGHYVVYFPGEPHCPCCAAQPGGDDIRKAIVKIRWPQ